MSGNQKLQNQPFELSTYPQPLQSARNSGISSSRLDYNSSMFSSQISSQKSQKIIFKITFNNECKRIPQEKGEAIYEDIMKRCLKSFSLDGSLFGRLGFKTDSTNTSQLMGSQDMSSLVINCQEQLNQYIQTQLSQSQNCIKFSLVPCQTKVEKVFQGAVDNGQNSSKICQIPASFGGQSITSQSQEEQSKIRHILNPKLLMKIFQELQSKGTISIQDVKRVNQKNNSISREEQLAKLTDKECLNTLVECEQLVSSILASDISTNSSKYSSKPNKEGNVQGGSSLTKSEGDNKSSSGFMFSQLTQNKSGEDQENSQLVRSTVQEAQSKLQRLSELKATGNISGLMEKSKYSMNTSRFSNVRNSMCGTTLRHNALLTQQSQIIMSRTRTKSIILDTPTGDDVPSSNFKESGSPVKQSKSDKELATLNQQQLNLLTNKQQAQFNQQFKDPMIEENEKALESDEEFINMLSDSIQRISERNESLEVSLALDESYIRK